jgi:Ca2+-binding EF-hand superfamily protein
MSQLGVFLARQELRVVFDNFDQNKDGNIAYTEFVNVLKVSVTNRQFLFLFIAFPSLDCASTIFETVLQNGFSSFKKGQCEQREGRGRN